MLQRKIQDYFGHMSLQRRLLSFFVMVCIIPLILIGSSAVIMSLSSSRDSAIDFSDSTLQQIQTRIENYLDVAERVSLQLASDGNVQHSLRTPLANNIASRYEDDLTMDTYLNYELTYIEELYALYIIGENKGKYKSAYNSFRDEDMTHSLWYKSLISSSDPIWFPAHKDSFALLTSGQQFITRGVRIKDLSSNGYLGVVMVDIELERINQILTDSFSDLGQIIIIDENDLIITSTQTLFDNNDSVVRDAIQKSARSSDQQLNGINNAIILQYPLSDTGWKLIGLIPASNILRDSIITTSLLIGMILAVTVITYIIARAVTATITKPVDDMIDQMKEVESGNFDVSTPVRYDDEIGNLTTNFNTMTNRVSGLMDQVVEEQQKLRKYELKALQSQINPHFLYNTLDSVVWLARMQQHEEIVKVVNALTQLFRTSLSRGKDIITIEDEIDHVSSYLMIQKFRYRTHFDYDIEIPEAIYHYKTMKLILQPLVENAIYHGLKVKRGGGSIHIRAEEFEDHIRFKVIDTGVGMTKETLDGIHLAFETNEESNVTMYGIRNVNDRLRIFFGKDYGLRYESTLGEGTTATITIPKTI